MVDQLSLFGPHKDFENIKHLSKDEVEFWSGRELMEILGYSEWKNFEIIVKRAKTACIQSGQTVSAHFREQAKKVKVGTETIRVIKDWQLDRYACYLIAQNADPIKPAVAQAQSYLAIQARKYERSQQNNADEKRLFTRNKVKEENKKLARTAKSAGVTKFGSFNDAGYLGLYGMKVRDIEEHKGIKRGELLDRAGSTELAANLFRVTQTDEKIRHENIRGQDEASRTHFTVGSKVRRTIREIGGTMPEQMPPEKNIKELKKSAKRLKS